MAGDVDDLALLDAGGRRGGGEPARSECPESFSGRTPAAAARRLMISATDWSESRRSVRVSMGLR
jgi:hypothetical protein